MNQPRTPTRRSIRTRGQPAVNYETGNEPNDIYCDGKPARSRPTNFSVDFPTPRSTPTLKKTVRSLQKSKHEAPEIKPRGDHSESDLLDEDAEDDDEYKEEEEETSEEEAEYVDASEDGTANDDDEELPVTRSPSKSRKRKQPPKTPQKKAKIKTIAHPTLPSKAALSKRRSEAKKTSSKFVALPTTTYGSAFDNVKYLPPDPWLRAMHVLHVGNRPDALPCRDDEFHQVLENVGNLLEEGSGGCICKSLPLT